KLHAGPFSYERPAFFTGLMRDLRAGRKALEFIERKTGRTRDHAIHGEPPISEAAGQEAFERLGLWRLAADGNNFRDFAAIEFTRERMMRHQDPLSGVGERFAEG